MLKDGFMLKGPLVRLRSGQRIYKNTTCKICLHSMSYLEVWEIIVKPKKTTDNCKRLVSRCMYCRGITLAHHVFGGSFLCKI